MKYAAYPQATRNDGVTCTSVVFENPGKEKGRVKSAREGEGSAWRRMRAVKNMQGTNIT